MSEQENSIVQHTSDDAGTKEDLVCDIVQNVGNENEKISANAEILPLCMNSDITRKEGDKNSSGCIPKVHKHVLPGETEVNENSSKKNRRKKRQKSSPNRETDGDNSLPNAIEALVPQFNIDKLNEVFNVLRLVAPKIQEAKECEVQNGAIGVSVPPKKDRWRNRKKEKIKDTSVEKHESMELSVDGQQNPEEIYPQDKHVEPLEKSKKEKRKKKNKKQISNALEGTAGIGTENVPVEPLQEQTNCTLENVQKEVPGKRKTKLKPKRNLRVLEGEEAANSSTSARASPRDRKRKNSSDRPFDDHWPPERLQEGLEKGILIEGVIRINQKQFKDAYVSVKSQQDILIEGVFNRNRALEGDVVALIVNDSCDWKTRGNYGGKKSETKEKESENIKEAVDVVSVKEITDEEEALDENEILPISAGGKLQRTAKVVGILSAEHSRKCVGFLKIMKDKSDTMALFSPRDSRVPRLKILRKHTPLDFWKNPDAKSKTLYLANIAKWSHIMFAMGEIIEEIGESVSLEAETTALLLENDIDTTPYPAAFSDYFPDSSFFVSPEEIANRVDLRKDCIFTIDPATAKDLDDAMSCKELENGNLEIGVHISDVTHFLHEGTPLDRQVSKRATSVYLVDKVHHMLPLELCLLCSLSPGADKLAYSVVWEITKDAEIVNQRIFRSVIHSCAKLAYEHAQLMIDNPDKEWKPDELPSIHNGFTVADLPRAVNNLQKIAVQLRRKRFKDGALRIDQTKIGIHLDPNGMPIAYRELVNTESNRLIEEFMLLANMTTAKFTFDHFPDVAFLRCHPEPHSYPLEQLKEAMEMLGIHLDISSAGALQGSLARHHGDDFLSKARTLVLNALCAKTMSRAKYFCSSVLTQAEFWHYALSVSFYTHFTSPIRRYADIMVHRLLNAALDYCPKPDWSPNFVQRIAANCNKQKYSAKLAGEQSIKLYLSLYIFHHQPVLEQAVVTDVKDHSFDVIVIRLGLPMRIYVNKMENVKVFYTLKDKFPSLTLLWKASQQCPTETTQMIEVFTIVQVNIHSAGESVKMEASLIRPSSVDCVVSS